MEKDGSIYTDEEISELLKKSKGVEK